MTGLEATFAEADEPFRDGPGLHFHKNWGQAAYRRMIVQGIVWTLKLPVPAGGLNVDITDDDLKLPEQVRLSA